MGREDRGASERPARVAALDRRVLLAGAQGSGGRRLTAETAPAEAGLEAAALYAGAFSSLLSGGLGRASRRAQDVAGLPRRGQRCGGLCQAASRRAQATAEGTQVSRRPCGRASGGVRALLEGNLRCPGPGGVVDGFPGARY